MAYATKAYIFKPGEGEVRWMGETSTYFLATGALTGEAFALVEEQAKCGVSVPLHRHAADMESFCVLEGEVSFYLGDQSGLRVAAGTFVHIPGGEVHGFRLGWDDGLQDGEEVEYDVEKTPKGLAAVNVERKGWAGKAKRVDDYAKKQGLANR